MVECVRQKIPISRNMYAINGYDKSKGTCSRYKETSEFNQSPLYSPTAGQNQEYMECLVSLSKTWLLVSKRPMIAGGTEMQRCEIQVINS